MGSKEREETGAAKFYIFGPGGEFWSVPCGANTVPGPFALEVSFR